MKVLKTICKLLNIPYKVITIKHDCKALLIEDNIMFEDYLLSTPFGRDLIHRAWLKRAGLDEAKNYQAMYDDLRSSR